MQKYRWLVIWVWILTCAIGANAATHTKEIHCMNKIQEQCCAASDESCHSLLAAGEYYKDHVCAKSCCLGHVHIPAAIVVGPCTYTLLNHYYYPFAFTSENGIKKILSIFHPPILG